MIITAGIPRKPGMSRDDLISTNAGIVKGVTEQIVQNAPDSILILVSNPLDAMCHVAYAASQFPKNRVIGMAGVLDSARFRTFIAMELNVSVENTHAFLKTGSAYYAPASSAVEMAEAILKDKKKILPCAAYLQGEYGYNDLFIGVPVKLGAGGIEEIIEISLTDEEKTALDKSAAAVQELKETLANLGY